ncbi:Clavata3/ESR (CLE) gene family member [Medicago truncatula]|uniref:Clavata3/ESR (CLE) gene family member n=1 Tax=Medicago truncatula TaxID=3880 RepID=A0A072V608_MEDTR|nr:Clavata3/ESR (CLE) gene family member [Medicago truncatula]
MRLSKLILIVMLLCFLFSACVGSNMMVRKTLFHGAKKTSDQTLHVHKCNHKKNKFVLCSKKNTDSDDKRHVPTGPNPLHNR